MTNSDVIYLFANIFITLYDVSVVKEINEKNKKILKLNF